MLALTSRFGVSSATVECARNDEYAENYYDEGPDVWPEADYVSTCLEE